MKPSSSAYRFLAFGILSLAASAQEPASWSAETFGSVSGDTPLHGLGLVLELVDGQSPAPKLRLFGGPAGHPASIGISTERAQLPGPRSSTRCITDVGVGFEGIFDMRGYFEVPLANVPASTTGFYAQGMHTGLFDLAPGGEPLVQLSNGLQVFATPEENARVSFDDLLPHLPAEMVELASSTPLAERLQASLNSAGDEIKVKLHVEASVGAGANAGGSADVEFQVVRTAEGFYDVAIEGAAAAKAGAEVTEGLEANASIGIAQKKIFRFYSAPGAARGIFGMMLALSFPELAPARWADQSGLFDGAAEKVANLREVVQSAQERVAQAEETLRLVLEVAVERSLEGRTRARALLADAKNDLRSAAWYQVPAAAARLALCAARAAAAQGLVIVTTATRDGGIAALDAAKEFVERHREKLQAVLAEIARLPRILSALLQLRGYTVDHYAATELSFKQAAGLQLGIPLPVKVEGLGAGVEAGLEMKVMVRFERPTAHSPSRIVVARQLELAGKAAIAYWAGVEIAGKKTGALIETFEHAGGSEWTRSWQATLASDNLAKVQTGFTVANGTGLGRQWSLAIGQHDVPAGGFGLGDLIAGQLGETIANTEIGFALQDRRFRTFEISASFSIAGNGGGIEFTIEQADQGRLLARSTTIGEAVTSVLERAEQVLDPSTATVRAN